ncbi:MULTISPECIES: abortive infection family protein [unclassified Methylobacterium]|uniref:abortive infection family protein n=1 Tax=unclassified Methylobacterium TaxID=2615210 RepID=UPI001AEF2F24|nr:MULTISPECIES: abortive infection family protein [unclassified Methylobacterium]
MLSFSPYLVSALADVITGGGGNDPTPPIGIYRSGPTIERFFMDCGVEMSIGNGSRVPATIDVLRDLIRRGDGTSIERIIVRVCDPREYLANPEKAQAVLARLNAALEPDGFAIMMVSGKAQFVARQASGAVAQAIAEKTRLLNFDTVQRDIARALDSAESDPESATTSACSLIESVCRSILVELGQPLPSKKDIDGLMRAVQEPLKLSPGRSDLPAEAESDIRQILGGLTSVAKGLGSLRTHAGDAHGRERGYRRIDPRIARLAINSAASVAMFLTEIWEHAAAGTPLEGGHVMNQLATLTNSPLPSNKAYAMVQRRAEAAGIKTKIGNHTFRATGITTYLRNGGTLKRAAAIANHASTRTIQLYDRRTD